MSAKKKSSPVRMWAMILLITGLGIAFYKSEFLGIPTTPEAQAEVWTIQARISFKGTGGPAKLSFSVPYKTPGFLKLDEDFISSRFGLTTETERDNQVANWAVRRARGDQLLYYRLSVARSEYPIEWSIKPRFPEVPQYEEPYGQAIRAILDDVRQASADVESYTRELLAQLNTQQPNENVELIRKRATNQEEWVREIINVLKGVKIPAREIWGMTVQDARTNVQLTPLLQVHNGKRWITYHPSSGAQGIPDDYLVWSVGQNPLVQLEGGTDLKVEFSIVKSYQELIEVARKGTYQLDSMFARISLLALPVEDQNVFRLLLMVPLGAALMVFLRTVVGISTFGTFMPILIAIAFRETQLVLGLVMFTVIVSIGLMIRFYLERLMLLLVPRLASILIIVVLLMLVISFITNGMGAERFLSIALFPMVILAMTIERMSIVWEENGAGTAMKEGFGSLVVACMGYLVMTNEYLMYIMFVFPEMLLVLLGISLMMGRYTGYRLTELVRFKDMAKYK